MRVIRDKVALVTGAGSGLGRAIAARLAKEGAKLHLADINAAAMNETAAQIRATGQPVAVTVCDLADNASLDSLVADVHVEWGGLDILVNNAGIGGGGPIDCCNALSESDQLGYQFGSESACGPGNDSDELRHGKKR